MVPSASDEFCPSRVTWSPTVAVWSKPASAVGAWFSASAGRTVTRTMSVAVPPRLSVTWRRKVSTVFWVTAGAVKLA